VSCGGVVRVRLRAHAAGTRSARDAARLPLGSCDTRWRMGCYARVVRTGCCVRACVWCSLRVCAPPFLPAVSRLPHCRCILAPNFKLALKPPEDGSVREVPVMSIMFPATVSGGHASGRACPTAGDGESPPCVHCCCFCRVLPCLAAAALQRVRGPDRPVAADHAGAGAAEGARRDVPQAAGSAGGHAPQALGADR